MLSFCIKMYYFVSKCMIFVLRHMKLYVKCRELFEKYLEGICKVFEITRKSLVVLKSLAIAVLKHLVLAVLD